MGRSKTFSREWRKSERAAPNFLPVITFKINFNSTSNSCFGFCNGTTGRPDFTGLANVTKPILGKF